MQYSQGGRNLKGLNKIANPRVWLPPYLEKIELKVLVHYIGTVNLKQKYTDLVHWIYLQFPNITKTIVLVSEA